MTDAPVSVHRQELDSPVVVRLITALNAELAATYNDPRANHFRLDPAEVAPGRGTFLVAYDGDEAVGCGAIRLIAEDTAEIKRMYVAPESRGRGVGRLVLAALEAAGRGLGATRVLLETGVRQERALALYESAGYARIPPYGEYISSPETSLCMKKAL